MATQTLVREDLRWLFTAHFDDDTTIVQDQDDKCLTRSDGTGSAFTDVLAKDGLLYFELGSTAKDETVGVDLITGAFIVNGTPFVVHDQYFEPQNHKLRLIYFRENRVDQKIDSTGTVVETLHYANRYFIGWQSTVKGKNIKYTLAVG